jgi:hypothetical protein
VGDDQERKRKRQYLHLRDESLAKLSKPGLWSLRPDILARDFVVSCAEPVELGAGDLVPLEWVGGSVRAVVGYREVGRLEDPGALAAAIKERGGVAMAAVQERSAFGDITVRIVEEEN